MQEVRRDDKVFGTTFWVHEFDPTPRRRIYTVEKKLVLGPVLSIMNDTNEGVKLNRALGLATCSGKLLTLMTCPGFRAHPYGP